MTKQPIDIITEYNTKAMETMRALGDLNVASAEWFVAKQVELSNALLQTGVATSKEIASAKTPAEAALASGKLIQALAETLTGFVKESSTNAEKTRDEFKAVIDDAVKLNSEYAGKAIESGVETIKKTANKAA